MPFTDLVEACDPSFADQQVDFYCPRAKLVIEIDGSQHREEAQESLDRRRDDYLRRNGIETVRIPVGELYPGSASLANVLALFAARLESDVPAFDWELVGDKLEWRQAAGYELLMRTQVALLQLMRAGVLDLEARSWRISATSDVLQEAMPAIVVEAFEDICDMAENLCLLLGRDFQRPQITVSGDAADARIDIGLLRCWSEDDRVPGIVYVRNDYFEDRRPFAVATAPAIAYDTVDETRREPAGRALRFFLKRLFGYDEFRSGQEGIIKKALARNATLGILPTGSGKSLCYQMACLLQPCVSFVVCPIISLIQDQERNLLEFGISRIARIDGQMASDDKHAVTRAFGQGRHQIIWVSPERFQMREFRDQLLEIAGRLHYGYAVIDEVHCLSEWGHEFRVSYLKLPGAIRAHCPGALLLGLTATASFNVLVDLKAELDVTDHNIQTAETLDRQELAFHIRRIDESSRLKAIDEALDEIEQRHREEDGVESLFEPAGDDSVCGIIFANTKKNRRYPGVGCQEILDHLISQDIGADVYHADRGADRSRVQQRYLDNEFTVMVATKAFGMGVNKRNVRYTIHSGLPWSIEAFYQEAGRAGRDDDPKRSWSDCYILYVPDANAERTERLFAASTTIEEIQRLQDDLQGDLSTLFFLWNRNHDSLEREKEHILAIHEKLIRECDERGLARISFTGLGSNKKGKVEQALYKLAIMGAIEDWTVDYRGQRFDVKVADLGDNAEMRMREAVERYIGRHSDAPVSFVDPDPSFAPYAAAYEQATPCKKLIGLIDALLSWTNDNIVFSRRRAIGNMLALCESERSDEEIRDYINRYFKLDVSLGNQLDLVIGSPGNFMPWIDVFYTLVPTDDPLERMRTPKGAEDLREIPPLCDRYREGSHGNIGLEWVTMMSRLLADEYLEREIADQLSFVFAKAGDYPSLDVETLLDETLALAATAPSGARDALGAAVVSTMPQQAHRAYQALGDHASLAHLLEGSLEKLRATWERKNHGR
ncbi:RecQ family ATP-dependent DNA helicase [Enterorhabdus sp. P55]|uniref:RecQ family ATP-dependent DNA helicase n=1 Tax=Enterorhabdus sp. P55 TaxID=2304571 RepID=UPI001371481E